MDNPFITKDWRLQDQLIPTSRPDVTSTLDLLAVKLDAAKAAGELIKEREGQRQLQLAHEMGILEKGATMNAQELAALDARIDELLKLAALE